MATFVLVHGAWHGGWCWKKLTPLLRAAGHDVYAPTLTGLGERAHLLTPATGLDTHVQDIVAVLEYEDLRDVVLVGHSYGGLVIAGVAALAPERVGHLIYLDAFVPMDGDRSIATLAARTMGETWAQIEAQIRASGERGLIPAPADGYGVTDAEDLRWLRERLTPQPGQTQYQRAPGDEESDRRHRRSYIVCPATAGVRKGFTAFGEHIAREGGRSEELAGGHDIMVTRPAELSALLSQLATTTAQITAVS
jgi:pimeloyl-ACP methyl ester carboxylesterase